MSSSSRTLLCAYMSSSLSIQLILHFLRSGYGPRPVAFASTISEDGKCNLSPFSYTTFVNHDPPTIIVSRESCSHALDSKLTSVDSQIGFSPFIKNTFANIIATGEATINMISEDFVEAANFSCIDAPTGVSEWGLTYVVPIPRSRSRERLDRC